MTSPVLPEINSSGIATVSLAYGSGKACLILWNSDQMYMVRHQTPCPNHHIVSATPFSHQFDVGEVILLAEKSLQPPVTTQDNMMGNSRTYDSCNSCHKEKLAEEDRFVKFKILSPKLLIC